MGPSSVPTLASVFLIQSYRSHDGGIWGSLWEDWRLHEEQITHLTASMADAILKYATYICWSVCPYRQKLEEHDMNIYASGKRYSINRFPLQDDFLTAPLLPKRILEEVNSHFLILKSDASHTLELLAYIYFLHWNKLYLDSPGVRLGKPLSKIIFLRMFLLGIQVLIWLVLIFLTQWYLIGDPKAFFI